MPSAYIDGLSNNDLKEGAKNSKQFTADILMRNLNGVEGIPYQFMDTVDNRIELSSNQKSQIGRKYAEKIVSRMPLLFLTPCEPLFVDGKKDNDTNNVLFGALMSQESTDISSLVSSKANGVRYYTAQFATYEYYNYLNFMLNNIANYLGLSEESINAYDSNNPDKVEEKTLGNMSWQDELNVYFSDYFYQRTVGAQSLFFYCDSIDSVSESFTNDTTQSSLASQINGYSDQVKEIQFLLGGDKGGVVGNALGSLQDVLSDSDSFLKSFGENILKIATGDDSLIGKMSQDSTLSAISAGGKIIFPEIWSDSSYSKSYSIDIKLRSPDHDSLSIFMNILKPYCKLLALTMPRAFRGINGTDVDPNGYGSPFLVKAACKGLFNIDMGIITSLSVTKGATCAWNDDGLPTQIDISLDIKDLYSTLAMSGNPVLSLNIFEDFEQIINTTKNAAYMDFLANMAGLNVNEMLPFRTLRTQYYNLKNNISQIPSTLNTRFDQAVANFVNKISWLR